MFVELRIKELALDASTDEPVLLLKEVDGDRVLPVWIGVLEAASIVYVIEGVEPPRPFTHDLMKMVVEQLDAGLTRVDIDSLEEGIFHANLHLSTASGGIRLVDCRPSDAIALAVRMGAPIFAREELLNAADSLSVTMEAEGDSEEALKDYLENLDPKAFGKYKM